MGDENPIRTLGDYSKPSHEGYRNTIELPAGNNVVPLRSDTIRKDRKTPQRYPGVPTTPWRISIRSMDSFQGLTTKSPSSWHRPLAPKDLALYDNESWNDPRDFAKPVKEIALPQDVPSTSDRRLIEIETQLEKALLDFDSHQEKRLSHLKTQLGQQQDDMIGKINLLWKTISEKLNDTSSPENAGNSMAPKSIAAISHDKREELKKK
ncbi:hypothetical protein Tco_1361430 [Tanacetum coccineum]